MSSILARLIAIMTVLLASSGVRAGTISGSVRNLNGSPIEDQAARRLSIVVTTAQGIRLEAVRMPDGKVTTTDSRITLQVEPVDPAAPDKLTYRVTLDDSLFANRQNRVVVVDADLSGRVPPGSIRNVVGTADSIIHLAFPRREAIPLQCDGCRTRSYGTGLCVLRRHGRSLRR